MPAAKHERRATMSQTSLISRSWVASPEAARCLRATRRRPRHRAVSRQEEATEEQTPLYPARADIDHLPIFKAHCLILRRWALLPAMLRAVYASSPVRPPDHWFAESSRSASGTGKAYLLVRADEPLVAAAVKDCPAHFHRLRRGSSANELGRAGAREIPIRPFFSGQ